MIDRDCIFCKIAGGDIPSSTVYEDEQFRVLLDLSPATKGHALILPKQHYANIFEITNEKFLDTIHQVYSDRENYQKQMASSQQNQAIPIIADLIDQLASV